jgi:predicted nucleotidyltransferase
MAKTALDLTAEQLQAYRPGKELDERLMTEQWKLAWEVARMAAHLLREGFGANRIVVFGSLAKRAWFTSRSDIDLAAWGIPTSKFYRAVATVTGISPDFEVNLVDPEDCRLAIRQVIEREGIDL